MLTQANVITEKIELVEVPISSNSNAFSFPQNQENIESGYVEGIIAYSVNETTISPKNRAVVNQTIFKKAYLELSVDNDIKIMQIPLTFFNPANNNGLIRLVARMKVNFPKSRIIVPELTGLVQGEAFVIGFIYSNRKPKPKR